MFDIRQDIGSIGPVLIDTPTGLKALLMAVVDVVSAQHISRENIQRKIVVQANVAGRVDPINAGAAHPVFSDKEKAAYVFV